MFTKVTGLVLAAGSSERMGGDRPKQLLRFGDHTMVSESVDHAQASRLDEVVVVVGAASDKVAADLEPSGCRIVEDPSHAHETASVRAGLEVIDADHAVVVLAADMPGVAPEVIDALIEAGRSRSSWAIATEYGDGLPNYPLLLSPQARQAVADSGDESPVTFLIEHPPGTVDRLVLTERPPVDVNTPEDYTEALRRRGLNNS